MSIPFGNETVTLVQKVSSVTDGKTHISYQTSTLTGCSWRRTTKRVLIGDAVQYREVVICRIPHDQIKPNTGDLLILGAVAVTVTSGADYNVLIEKYRDSDGGFVVSSVSDNARPGDPLPHYAAKGA